MTTEYRDDDRLDDAIAAQHRRELACICGHDFARHSSLGACMVIVPTQLMRMDGGPTRIERTYCPCPEYRG